MMQLIIGLVFTVLPITELRVGLPIVIDWCLRNNLNILPFFLLVILLNALVVFFIYFFLDKIHHNLLKFNFYSRRFDKIIEQVRRKNQSFEKKFHELGYLALLIFVAIPLPGTGAWTGTLLAWLVGLEKKKSILAISLGVAIAGLIMLVISFGFFNLFYK